MSRHWASEGIYSVQNKNYILSGGFIMASKKTNQVNLKGFFDMDVMEVTELTKDDELRYDFKEILSEFNGKQVSITIKEENELPVKDNE